MANFQEIANFEIPDDLLDEQKEALRRYREKIKKVCYIGALPEELIKIFQRYNKSKSEGNLSAIQEKVERMLIESL